MILYSSSKTAFINDINDKSIIDILKNKSRRIAYLLHKYFPCVSFPYISDLNGNNFVYSFF